MKNSQFNVLVEERNQRSIVYNTLTGSIVEISNELLNSIENSLQCITNQELLDELLELGIIVNDDFDELNYYENLHNSWKEGKEVVSFNILFTYDCNFECPYCYQGRGEKGNIIHGYKNMDNSLYEIIKCFIKETTINRKSKKLELVLYGGEPFLVPELCKDFTDDIFNWCKENNIGFQLHALSNGSLITKEIIDWLSYYKCRLQIPVDGCRKTHNNYRYYKNDKRGSYDDIIDVLKLTKGTDIETHIRISITDETSPLMVELLDHLKQSGLTHVYPDFCYITAFTEACLSFDNHCLDDTKLFKIMPELWNLAYERGFPLDIRPQIQPLPCSSIADGSFIIDPYGDIYKCWEQVGQKEHVVGRIKTNGLLEKTDIYYDVLRRNPLKIEQCRKHLYLPACGGGCVCKAYWQSGTYHAPGCGTELRLLKDKVKTYLKTINTYSFSTIVQDKLILKKIEGRQKPKIGHCYVLV